MTFKIDYTKPNLEITSQMQSMVGYYKLGDISRPEIFKILTEYVAWYKKQANELYKSGKITKKARIPQVLELLR